MIFVTWSNSKYFFTIHYYLLLEAQSASGGDDGIRTHDPLLAGQVLSQLSYTPICLGIRCFSTVFVFKNREYSFYTLCPCVSIELSSRTVARKVFSPLQSLTSVFGMGTGGPSAFVRPTFRFFRIDPSKLNNSFSLPESVRQIR